VKYANDFFLLAKEGTVLQVISDRVTEIGRCCGMEMNVGEKIGLMRNLKATIPSTDYDRSKRAGECGVFQQFV